MCHPCVFTLILFSRQSLEERLLDCYIESYEGAPKDKVCFIVAVANYFNIIFIKPMTHSSMPFNIFVRLKKP